MSGGRRVPLPAEAEPPYRVWVSGVPQQEGRDYEVRGRALHFARPLVKEGRLGFWRWLSIFLGLVGTYRRDDSVDVQYRVGGRERLATGLDIEGSEGSGQEPRRSAGGRAG
jgi:hypothetical protein